jgi:PilZ domain
MENSTAVRVWGLDAQGRPFSNHAQAENVSDHNALLAGIHSPLSVGSVFGLQWQQCKTRCTVIAVFSSGASLRKFYVEPVSGQPWPWKATKRANARNASQDRRKSARHKIALSIEVRTKSGLPFKVRSSDVSSSGCYLEMLTPLPMGTVVELSFTIGFERVSTEATVRTSDLGVGMGLEFTRMHGDSQRRLQKQIDEVGAWMKPTLKKLVTASMTALVYVFMVIFWGGVRSLLAIEDLFTRKHTR